MAMDKKACEQKIVDHCDFMLTPIFEGFSSPRESLPVALLKAEEPQAAALSLLGSKDEYEFDIPGGVKFIIRKAPDGVVTIQPA